MKILLTILTFATAAITATAQTGGESVYSFLKLPVGSNAAALGGAAVASGNLGANNVFSNAAMIDSTADRYAALNYADYIADINFGSAAYCASLNNVWSMAGGVQFVNYGSFDYADEAGILGGTFSAKDYAIYVSGIRQVVSHLRTSVTLKTIFSHLETYKSWGMAFDFGAVYNFDNIGLTLAATANNVGFQCSPYTGGEREPLPLCIQVGASLLLEHAPLKFSATFTDLQSRIHSDFGRNLADHLVVGLELFPKSTVSVKTGMNVRRHNDLSVHGTTPFAGFSIGADVRLRRFAVQYSRTCYGAAASINMFTAELFLRQF